MYRSIAHGKLYRECQPRYFYRALLLLQDIAQEHGGLPREDAARFVRQLQTTGRYFVEAWS